MHADLPHGDRVALAARGTGVETEPGLQLDVGGKESARQREDVVLLAVAIRVLAGNAEGRLLAFTKALGKDQPTRREPLDHDSPC